LDAVARLPALRRVVALLVAVFGGLFWLVVGLDDQQDVAGWGLLASVFLVSLGVSVASAWGPIAAWQKVRAQWPDAEVVEAEIRVLNWDPFKQRKWTWMSPWNGVHHRAAWLLLEDRLVWMGLQGLPWPDSRQALPLHPVELVPNGTIPITGLPHAVVEPVFDRDTKGPVAGRFKLADPSNRSAMTLVIRSNGSAFSERFPAT
jgi:hypothetical protein